jgi:deoxyribodipyrimidine photo-lyase
MKLGIFIFRRDLRLEDNLGLLELINVVDMIVPIFIFDSHQIKKSEHNKQYFSTSAVQFICESVDDLNEQLKEKKGKLYVFFGKPHLVIKELLEKFNKHELVVGFNKDYSPYSIERDDLIKDMCDKYKVKLISNENDFFLTDKKELLKDNNIQSNLPFKQFGSFYKHAVKKKVLKPIKNKFNKYYKGDIHNQYTKYHELYEKNNLLAQNGGRFNVIIKLKHLVNFNDYNEKRDFLDYETTNISGYLNIGCVSEREVYWFIIKKLGTKTILLKQIYWRDFYLLAYIYLNNADSFDKYIDPRFDNIIWKHKYSEWDKLINCKTGFLLIDAAMSQMKQTGYLHNRGRLLLGCFWIKYLQIDMLHPIYGSQAGFSKYLLDAIGPSQNKMNHHWLLDFDYPGRRFGKGISGRPLKIGNDQIKKYDPECKYIKKWLPHLKDIDNKELYKWNGSVIHPIPIFDYIKRYKEWIELTKKF